MNLQTALTFSPPSDNNNNPSTSAQINSAISVKQDALTFGRNAGNALKVFGTQNVNHLGVLYFDDSNSGSNNNGVRSYTYSELADKLAKDRIYSGNVSGALLKLQANTSTGDVLITGGGEGHVEGKSYSELATAMGMTTNPKTNNNLLKYQADVATNDVLVVGSGLGHIEGKSFSELSTLMFSNANRLDAQFIGLNLSLIHI